MTYYGDIYVISKQAELYYISHENLDRLPFFEIEGMIRSSEGNHERLKLMMANRYKLDLKDLSDY